MKFFNMSKTVRRAFIIGLGLLGIGFVFLSVKWSIGNVIASHSTVKELAELSVALAPDDPQTHYALAVLSERSFLPEDLRKSLEEYEKTAARTPHNYLIWLDLGKAYERNGQSEKAEFAFNKAEELAPNYSTVKWIFGNYLLRSGKIDDGIAKIQFAANNDNAYIQPSVNLVWQYYQEDVDKLRDFANSSDRLKAAAAAFLARQKKIEDSIQLWSSVENAKNEDFYKESGEIIYSELIAEKRFLQAIRIKRVYSQEANLQIGKINNGSFEQEIRIEKPEIFDWTIKAGLLPQIGVDEVEKKGGNKSLVYVFNSEAGREFREVFQTVAVESGATYRLSFFYKSELNTKSPLKCEIIDAGAQVILEETKPLEPTSGWTEISVDIKIPDNTQAITVRINRDTCQAAFCPISGKIWFDEFTLSRIQ